MLAEAGIAGHQAFPASTLNSHVASDSSPEPVVPRTPTTPVYALLPEYPWCLSSSWIWGPYSWGLACSILLNSCNCSCVNSGATPSGGRVVSPRGWRPQPPAWGCWYHYPCGCTNPTWWRRDQKWINLKLTWRQIFHSPVNYLPKPLKPLPQTRLGLLCNRGGGSDTHLHRPGGLVRSSIRLTHCYCKGLRCGGNQI